MDAYSKEKILDDAHWTFEDHIQRIPAKIWRQLLLNDDDQIIFRGRLRRFAARNMGYGVIEITKEPLSD